jgi:acyl-CoA reductase-like NAD-dependent aldehyde dehydrogenase
MAILIACHLRKVNNPTHNHAAHINAMADRETITTISPTTNQPILTRHGPSDAELAQLPKTAQAAFKRYRQTSLSERHKIVKKALDIILSKRAGLAEELTDQMGRPIAYTEKEITTAVARGEYMLKISSQALADTPGEEEKGFKRWIRKVPVGPVLVLFAWNYPYLILVNSLIPALLAGCSVILKPSPQTPTIVEQVQKIFVEAGLEKDVVQYFHCGDFKKIEKVIQAPEIQLVCFTGSVAGGLAVQKAAAGRVDCKVGLELGGNDPAYVRPDVDLAWAADEIVDGAVFNSGQSCCALERVYVHESVHDDFVKEVQKVLANYKLGDPQSKDTNVGPVVSKAAKERVERQINDAIQKGAKDATPSNSTFSSPPSDGNYIKPTVLTDCTTDMTIMHDETFGPVIPIQSVKSDGEAIDLMNDSEFGLTASIWTKDEARGQEIAEEVEAGTVFVNRADFPSPDLAWTGWKNSGKGQTLSVFGFEQFVKLKNFHVKDYPVK